MATMEEKKLALANYLDCDVEEIEESYDDDHFEYGNEEWAVYDDDEANQAAYDDIESLVDDMGLESFTESFQEWILDNAVDGDYFQDALEESEQFYVDDMDDEEVIDNARDYDILTDEDFHEDEETGEEVLNDDIDLDDVREQLVERFIDSAGDPYDWFILNFGHDEVREAIKRGNLSLDMDKIVDECISMDGRGHFISYYDGDEVELENDLYAYRQN